VILDFLGRELDVLLGFGVDGRKVGAVRRHLLVVVDRERRERQTDAVFEAHFLLVLGFEMLADVRAVRPDGKRLPLVGRPAGVTLEQARPAVGDAADNERDAERPGAAVLGVLLDVVGHRLCQRLDGHRFAVAQPVGLGLPPGHLDEFAGVGDVAGAGDTDVAVGLVEFLDGVGLDHLRAAALVGRKNDALRRSHADAGRAALDRLAGVLDLVQSPVRRENSDAAVVGLLLWLSLHGHSVS